MCSSLDATANASPSLLLQTGCCPTRFQQLGKSYSWSPQTEQLSTGFGQGHVQSFLFFFSLWSVSPNRPKHIGRNVILCASAFRLSVPQWHGQPMSLHKLIRNPRESTEHMVLQWLGKFCRLLVQDLWHLGPAAFHNVQPMLELRAVDSRLSRSASLAKAIQMALPDALT